MGILDAVIVGCGPAGMTAAMQLRRMGHSLLLFEREKPGGLLRHAWCVENYPGVRGGMDGESLAALFLAKLHDLGIEPVIEEVLAWKSEKGMFYVSTAHREVASRTLILATGTRPAGHEIPIYRADDACCAQERVFCDFMRLRSMEPGAATIVGGGDAAFDYALSLADRGWSVSVAFRSERPRALDLLVDRAECRKEITIYPSFVPLDIVCDRTGVLLRGVRGDKEEVLRSEFLLVAFGRVPEDSLLLGIPLPDNLTGKVPSFPGLFVAGDVRRSLFRQAVIAAGDGMASAMAASAWLRKGAYH